MITLEDMNNTIYPIKVEVTVPYAFGFHSTSYRKLFFKLDDSFENLMHKLFSTVSQDLDIDYVDSYWRTVIHSGTYQVNGIFGKFNGVP